MFVVVVSVYYLQSIGYKFKSCVLHHVFLFFCPSSAIPDYYFVLHQCAHSKVRHKEIQ
jgi:hypothetical protein